MKLLSGLIGAFALVLSGLVVAPAANAASYPGTVASSCGFSKPASVRKNKVLHATYSVSSAGNGRPSGTATFKVYKVLKHGGLSFNRSLSNGYTGPSTRAKSVGKFHKKGKFVIQFSFKPNSGSVYRSCATGFRSFKVK